MVRRWLAGQFARPSGWAGRWLIGAWLDRIGHAMNALAFEALDIGAQDRVLEVGFGGGDLLKSILAATNDEVTGVDISEAMVKRVRRRFQGKIANGKLRLFRASAAEMPLAEASVDKACSVNNIYFWPDPERVLAEFARVIRPGGRLAICFEPPEELRKWPGHRFGFRLYDARELATLVEQARFGGIMVTEGRGRKPDRFLCLSAERLAA